RIESFAGTARPLAMPAARGRPAAEPVAHEPFADEPARPAATRGNGSAFEPPSDLVPDPRGLEVVITELAHELKNPMVTIKTFAQHFDKLLTDTELRQKFLRLATEAVDRMDGFLED